MYSKKTTVNRTFRFISFHNVFTKSTCEYFIVAAEKQYCLTKYDLFE